MSSEMLLDSFLLGYVVEALDIFNCLEYLRDDKNLKPYFGLDYIDTILSIKITGEDLESRPL